MGNSVQKVLYQPPVQAHPRIDNVVYLQNKYGSKVICKFIDTGAKYTILFSHGNADTLYLSNMWIQKHFIPNVKDVNFLIYEYTGYTRSDPNFKGVHKEPNEKDICADAEAAYFYLVDEQSILPQHIIIYGQSLGGGPSCDLAFKYKCAGLILQSTFLSVFRVVFDLRFNLWGDQFINIDKVKQITEPILVIHGVKDEIVPFFHGIELYQNSLLLVEPCWIEKAQHNNCLSINNQAYKRIIEFIKEIETGIYNDQKKILFPQQ